MENSNYNSQFKRAQRTRSLRHIVVEEIFRRNIFKKDDEKVSYLQLMGFLLLSAGVISIVVCLCCCGISAQKVPLLFFMVMLGVSFSFPDMLQDESKQVSTMRIVVFMMVNVICMLMLKAGWNATDIKDLQVNGWWVVIIAFVFSGKAAQSFIEGWVSKMNAGQVNLQRADNVPPSAFTSEDIARAAAEKNKGSLMWQFGNILDVTDSVPSSKAGNNIVAIYLKDGNDSGIPRQLSVQLNEKTYYVATEIIKNVGIGKIQIAQGKDDIADEGEPAYKGSICCKVKPVDGSNFTGVVTAGHICTNGNSYNWGWDLPLSRRKKVLISGNIMGNWRYQQITNRQDIAIVEVPADNDSAYQSFASGYHTVGVNDVLPPKPNVIIVTKNQTREAFIIDFNMMFPVGYRNATKYISNIVLLGDRPDREHSRTVSAAGDSGACVYYNDAEKKLVGIILGGDDKYTYCLPVKDTLDSFGFKPV